MADGFQEVPPFAPSHDRSEDKELNQDEGEEEEKAEAKAFNALLPVYRRKLRRAVLVLSPLV